MDASPEKLPLRSHLDGQAFCVLLLLIAWQLDMQWLWILAIGWSITFMGWEVRRYFSARKIQRTKNCSQQPDPSSTKRPVDGSRFLELVVLSELLTAEQLQAFVSKFPAGQWQRLTEHVGKLAEEFVQDQLLTSWQANLLLAGKYKGFMLGKYKLLKLLGSGGMSSVYLAEHTPFGRLMAVKVLPKSKAGDSTELAHFINSSRWTARLDTNHHFIHAHDLDQVGNTHFIVMDYFPGTTLKYLVKHQGPLDYFTAVNYIAQATEGIAALHQTGAAHLGLKPDQLYLTDDGVIKLFDCGLFWQAEDTRESLLNDLCLRAEGLDYRAPDLANSIEQVGTLADIYSLGCVLYFLLTGHAPYPAGTAPQRIMHHLRDRIPDLRDERPDAPARLIEILHRMLAKNPSERYTSAGHLYRDLDAFLLDEGGESQLALVP